MTDKKKSILIVDDDKDICRVLKDIFGTKGYEVEVVYNGFAAAELVKKKKFDIALIDLVMEEKNGVETMKEIQQLRPGASCFMMTAYPSDPNLKRGMANGALRIFKKPLDIDEMIKVFDKEIARKCKKKSG